MLFNFFKRKEKPEPQKLFYSTDIHSHVLPGIDDGSPNTDVSIALLEAMKSWGIDSIIATPHIAEESFENTPQTIKKAYDKLSVRMLDMGVDMNVKFSAEYRIDNRFRKMFEDDELIFIPNDYLLIENSFVQPPIDLKNIIYELQLKDIKPVLAHPERYGYYQRKKEIYEELFESGCEFQINLLSLAGYYGDREKETALWLANKGYISFVGTDLHHFGHVEIINKFLRSKEYPSIAERVAPLIKNNQLL
jgi:tyrosine-protein phosphatase YwqE